MTIYRHDVARRSAASDQGYGDGAEAGPVRRSQWSKVRPSCRRTNCRSPRTGRSQACPA